jgi:hypothetical protein
MQIESTNYLVDGRYEVQIGLAKPLDTALTPVEKQAFDTFGEPVVDCGGTFTTEGLTFTLPTDQRWFPSQFPVKQVFALADHSDANARAQLFRSTIQTRLVAARDAQIALSPGTTGRTVSTL